MEFRWGNPAANKIFQEAVEKGDFAIVKIMLKLGVYLQRNQLNRNGLTALQQSVLDGNRRLAILLLENGADIEAKTSNGWTCLHIAATLGDLDMVNTLINHCASIVSITKNEDLPIDLAATPEIKIELAQQMLKVGHSKLAQCYMEKLAAREGSFYILSADKLLGMACKSDPSRQPCYVQQDRAKTDLFIQDQSQATNYWQIQDSEMTQYPLDDDIWVEQSSIENANPTYLSYSSGYISEVIFDANSGECSKVRRSTSLSVSSGSSPRVRYPEVVGADPKQAKPTAVTPEEEDQTDGFRYGSLLRSGSNRRYSQKLGEKDSTLELVIDYSNYDVSGDIDDENGDIFSAKDGYLLAAPTSQVSEDTESASFSNKKSRDENSLSDAILTFQSATSKIGDTEFRNDPSDTMERITMNNPITKYDSQHIENEESRQPRFEISDGVNYETRSRNVRFDARDNANEFCNCPTCKKLGYAFSPDIRAPPLRVMHVGEESGLSAKQVMVSPLQYQKAVEMMQARNERSARMFHDENIHPSFPYGSDYPLKPRKRKKKLFSGIRSIFKDTIKVQRGGAETSPVVDDAGILFAFSLRERSRSKAIKNRNDVRRSNSFSGSLSADCPDMVNTYPHNQVVPPPNKFSDTYGYFDGDKRRFDIENFNQAYPTEYPPMSEKPKQCYEDNSDFPLQHITDDINDIHPCHREPTFESQDIEVHPVDSYPASYSSRKSFNEVSLSETFPAHRVSVVDKHSLESHTLPRESTVNSLLSQLSVRDNEVDSKEYKGGT